MGRSVAPTLGSGGVLRFWGPREESRGGRVGERGERAVVGCSLGVRARSAAFAFQLPGDRQQVA